MTSQKLNEEHEILRRFMAVVVSSAFWDSLSLCSSLLRESLRGSTGLCGVYGILQGTVVTLEGPTRKPRHASVLARTPTRKRFPHSTVSVCDRGPQMRGQIRRGRIWRFWGAPDFPSRSPKTLSK